MSIKQTELLRGESDRARGLAAALRRTRRLEAATIDARMRAVMITATLLVIPDLVLEEQPLRASWHTVATIGDWVIWLVFLVEFATILILAKDWRSWLRSYPLAPAMLVLTPPFAPAAIQALRIFRLLRLLRVARGFQLMSKLLTLDGLRYVMALAVFLVVGGGTIFASVETSVGHHVSTWDGIWWALGTVTTEGSNNIEVTTNAGRAIAIVLMLTGIGVFSIITGAIAQHFLSSSRLDDTEELSHGEKAIMARLDELAGRLQGVERAQIEAAPPHSSGRRITGVTTGMAGHEASASDDTTSVVLP
ncbi:MAG: potassium channel family protein [Solirubrobacteraceae bacterium]